MGRLRVILRVELAVEGGRVVRRRADPAGPARVRAEDAVTLARELVRDGADRLLVRDLDAEREGRPGALPLAAAIAAVTGADVAYRGAVRSAADVESVLAAGVSQAVIGREAFGDPAFLRYALDVLGPRLAVALDAHGSTLKVPSGPALAVTDAAAELAYRGVAAFVLSDEARAGTLSGPNLALAGRVCDLVDARVTYCGGIATLDDVRSVARLRRSNLAELLLATALWESRFTLPEALAAAAGSEHTEGAA